MHPLPIVERELRIRARRPSLYWLRGLSGAGSAVAALLVVSTFLLSGGRASGGAGAFVPLAWIVWACCLLEGARQTADAISEEQREGTLGLLFLTRLTGADVVLGKLAATGLNMVSLLLAVVPGLALSLLSGGVTGTQLFRTALALLGALFCSLAAGLAVSSISRDDVRAFLGTAGLVATWAWLPVVASGIGGLAGGPLLEALSPGIALSLAQSPRSSSVSGQYWTALAIPHLIAWALLAFAAWRVTRFRERESAAITKAAFRPSEPQQTRPPDPVAAGWLETAPAAWIQFRDGRARMVELMFYVPLAGRVLDLVLALGSGGGAKVLSAASPFASIGFFFSLVLAATYGARVIPEARRNGSLGLVLSTPVTVEDLLHGQWLAWKRMAFRPFVISAAVCLLLPVIVLMVTGSAPGAAAVLGGNIKHMVTLATDLAALGWVGMWLGMRARKASLTAGQVFALVIVAPALVLSCGSAPLAMVAAVGKGAVWIPILVPLGYGVLAAAKNLAFIHVARRNLRLKLRQALTGASSA